MKPSSSQRTVFAGFALVGVLLATVSVLGQVNAFSALTDAIGVTAPPPDAEPGSPSDPVDDSNDTGAGSESDLVDGDTPDAGGGSPGSTTDEAVLERLEALEEMVLALNDTDADTNASLTELATVVKDVSTQLDVINTRLASADKTLTAHGVRLDSHDTRLGAAEASLVVLRTEFGVLRTELDAAVVALADITPRVARLDPTGTYLGDVKPAQIVPRLKVDDIAGDWPISRTSGLLDGARLKVSNSSCWSAPRGFMNVLAPQIFEGVQCVRVAVP